MIHCEYCRAKLSDISHVKRHILTIQHTRNREKFHLSKDRYSEALRRAHDHPKDFCELFDLLSLKSSQDILALDDAGFFKLESDQHAEVVEALIPIIDQSIVDHHVNSLPRDLRKTLVEAYVKYNKK